MMDEAQNNLAALAKLEIVEKNMKAFLFIKAVVNEFTPPITSEDLMRIIEKEGIRVGVNKATLDEIISEKKWEKQILVAEGLSALPGEDAKLEFSFPTDKSLRPQITEDGHVDFHELNVVYSVEKDAVLIKKVPATLGSIGMDLFGKEIPAKYGKDVGIILGQGTYKDPTDNFVIRAATEGIIFYSPDKNTVEVQKLYVVNGSVDYSTGNINVKSSIDIKGNVRPGFSVTTPYNIQIKGTVEHSTISCEGNLTVKEGIIGDGKHLIHTGGDIRSGYITNQNIKCFGSVYAATEIRNSYIECNREVTTLKNNGVIIGGKISAANKISAATIGNLYNVPTILEVGVNFSFKENYLKKETEMFALQKMMENLKKNISLLSEQPQNNSVNSRLNNFRNEYEASAEKCDRVKKELKEMEKLYYDVTDPVICVSKIVYPGTIIKIKQITYEVKEELSRVMFKLVNGEITPITLN